MDSFERGYNQISIQKYRETLVGMCEGKVYQSSLRFYKRVLDPIGISSIINQESS